METAINTDEVIRHSKLHKNTNEIPSHAIQECVGCLKKALGDCFIVVGGAAMILLGSNRSTDGVDLLVPYDGIAKLTAALSPLRNNKLGAFIYTYEEPISPTETTIKTSNIQIQLLLETSSGTTYEIARPRSVLVTTIGNKGNAEDIPYQSSESMKARVLDTTEFIANKIYPFYSRPDTEVAHMKEGSDAFDIGYLCGLIALKQNDDEDGKACGILDGKIVRNYRIGLYHFYLLQIALDRVEARLEKTNIGTAWELFIHVGGRDFLRD